MWIWPSSSCADQNISIHNCFIFIFFHLYFSFSPFLSLFFIYKFHLLFVFHFSSLVFIFHVYFSSLCFIFILSPCRFVLSVVSPAVVVPSMLSLSDRGFGLDKGIPTLIVAAVSLDAVLAITGFGVCLGITFTSGIFCDCSSESDVHTEIYTCSQTRFRRCSRRQATQTQTEWYL